ncbi:hypothetical protein R1sor_005492 [Riccia sorocarpa]|uniref:Uncharacterized protein n=1 Tax=Riccia sorocarpa TaxID=122646 RepID=A0ABD3HP09_9MARC
MKLKRKNGNYCKRKGREEGRIPKEEERRNRKGRTRSRRQRTQTDGRAGEALNPNSSCLCKGVLDGIGVFGITYLLNKQKLSICEPAEGMGCPSKKEWAGQLGQHSSRSTGEGARDKSRAGRRSSRYRRAKKTRARVNKWDTPTHASGSEHSKQNGCSQSSGTFVADVDECLKATAG